MLTNATGWCVGSSLVELHLLLVLVLLLVLLVIFGMIEPMQLLYNNCFNRNSLLVLLVLLLPMLPVIAAFAPPKFNRVRHNYSNPLKQATM
jgi:hypothetical protein